VGLPVKLFRKAVTHTDGWGRGHMKSWGESWLGVEKSLALPSILVNIHLYSGDGGIAEGDTYDTAGVL
jgi:hypothetical protein